MEKDRRLIKEIAFLLNQNNIDYTNIFLDGYGETPFINGKKLGLGYTLDRFNHYGGYMNVNILVLADSFGNIIKNKIIIYGYKIGFDSIIPPERKAITKILETNDITILFSIIASPNPEGRIYAIESIFLNYLNEDNNEIIKKLVNKISYLKLDVFVGAGCVIHNEMIDSDEKIQFIIDNYYKRYKDSE